MKGIDTKYRETSVIKAGITILTLKGLGVSGFFLLNQINPMKMKLLISQSTNINQLRRFSTFVGISIRSARVERIKMAGIGDWEFL